jgi:hypothetical protein
MLILLVGVVLAAALVAVAVATDAGPILAGAATLAFVALGYVVPARRLPLFIVQRLRKRMGVGRAAFLFAVLGICLSEAAAVALDATDSYTRFSGWVALGGFSAIGASFVAAIRRTEAMKAGRVGEPQP